MRTKIIYVLTSNLYDTYLEETWISISSLRKYHPEAVVEIVVDQDTFATLVGYREKFTTVVNKIHPIDCPETFSSLQRSRFLKTNLRNIIIGDYLFIDSDTIIAGRLDLIDDIKCPLCAVLDYRVPSFQKGKIWFEKIEAMGWSETLLGQPQFNSGVQYVKDCPETYLFFDRWHQLWLECNKKNIVFDQISFGKVNVEFNYFIHELSEIWNYQVKVRPIVFPVDNALIYHYFTSVGAQQTFFEIELPYIYQAIRKEGNVSQPIMNQISNPSVLFSKRYVRLTQTQKKILYGSFFEACYYRLMQGLARRFPVLEQIPQFAEVYK